MKGKFSEPHLEMDEYQRYTSEILKISKELNYEDYFHATKDITIHENPELNTIEALKSRITNINPLLRQKVKSQEVFVKDTQTRNIMIRISTD